MVKFSMSFEIFFGNEYECDYENFFRLIKN